MSTYDKFAPCKLTRREMTSGMLYLATLSFTVDTLNDLVTAPLPMLCYWDEKRFSSLDEKNVDEFILPCHRRRPWEQFDHGLENCFADNPFYWVDYLVLRLKFTSEVAPTTFDKVLSILNLLHRSSNWVTFSWNLVSRSCNGKIFLIQFGHGQLVPIEKKSHKLNRIVLRRIKTVAFSSYSTYASFAFDPVKEIVSCKQKWKNQPITMPILRPLQYILPLMTLTTQFSLDCEQPSCKWQNYFSSNLVRLIFIRSYGCLLMIETPTSTQSWNDMKASL